MGPGRKLCDGNPCLFRGPASWLVTFESQIRLRRMVAWDGLMHRKRDSNTKIRYISRLLSQGNPDQLRKGQDC